MATDLGSEQVLMDGHRGHYFGLNASGRFLFGLLEEPRTVGALVDALVERYQIPREMAVRDVGVFLDDMTANSLVQVEGGAG